MTLDRPLLRQPEIRALLGARLANALALSALATVVAYQTYITTHDPLSLGWLGLVEAIPAVSLALLGGHLADRRDRRSLVLAGGAVMMLCAAALAVLSQTGSLTLLGILAVIFVTWWPSSCPTCASSISTSRTRRRARLSSFSRSRSLIDYR